MSNALLPGTVVRCWETQNLREMGFPGDTGIYVGYHAAGHIVQTPQKVEPVDTAVCLALNDPELRKQAEEASRREWNKARPERRKAFIVHETGKILEAGQRQGEMGLCHRYGVKCSACGHVSRVPSDTWDHAVECRNTEPRRKAMEVSK